MIEATQKGLRTTVVALLLIAAVALTALSFHRRDSRLTVQWDFLHWHFGAYEKRDTVGITPVSSIVLTSLTRHHTTVRKGYHLGRHERTYGGRPSLQSSDQARAVEGARCRIAA
jgi:hypothetical protein